MLETAKIIAPVFAVNPEVLDGLLFAEHGDADINGVPRSVDMAPRPAVKQVERLLGKYPLPGAIKSMLAGIPAWGIKDPVKAWIPQKLGWKVGLLRLDWTLHGQFCATGEWDDLDKSAIYLCDYLNRSRRHFQANFPALSHNEIEHAAIASTKVGTAVIDSHLKELKPLRAIESKFVDAVLSKVSTGVFR